MRLTEDIALVGGGTLTGFGLSADLDCHVYLLDGGSESALLDCGMGTPAGMAAVLRNIQDAGVDPDRVRRVLLTHVHTDHAGGAAAYRRRLGARIGIGAHAASALRDADDMRTQFGPARAAGLFPADYSFMPCPVDDELADDETIKIGRLTVRFLSTPGHCAGHGSYLIEGPAGSALCAGDALFAGGRIQLQAIPDCDVRSSIRSLQRLGDERFDALLPGHGPIVMADARAHLDLALDAVGHLAMPRNLV